MGCVRCTKRAACSFAEWAVTCKPGALKHISDGEAIDKIMKQAIAKWNIDRHFLSRFMIYLAMLYIYRIFYVNTAWQVIHSEGQPENV